MHHSRHGFDQALVCQRCHGTALAAVKTLAAAAERFQGEAGAKIRAEYAARPELPYEMAANWLVHGGPEPKGYRWGSYPGRQVAGLLAHSGQASQQRRLSWGRRVQSWPVEQAHRFTSSDPDRRAFERDHWQARFLTADGSLWREEGGSAQRAAARRISSPGDLVPDDVVTALLGRLAPHEKLPSIGEYNFDSWVQAGAPPVEQYLASLHLQPG